MKVKEESEKVGLKLNIQKTKIMASPIYGETVETVSDFIFGGSKITADGDCSHEIKRRLLLGRKVMTNLDSIIPSNEHPGLISFRMHWLDLLAVQGTLKRLLHYHSSKASILRCSAFFVQLSYPYMTT